VSLVSGVHLISRTKQHLLHVLFVIMEKSIVCQLPMIKMVFSTIDIPKLLN